MRIGFIGIGIMGRGMVKNLIARGYDVTLWNRTPATPMALFPGHAVKSTPAELAACSDVVISCVSGPGAVEQVIQGKGGVLEAANPALTYVECSTIGPDQAEKVGLLLSDRGTAMLAAPVTGSRLGAENGTLVFMTGGNQELSVKLEPLLLSMGQRVIHCGSVSQAFLVKLANNTLVSFMLEGLCEGAVALSRGSVPLRTWLEVIQSSVLSSKFYEFKGEALIARDFSTHFALDLLAKDQNLMLEQAVRNHVPMPGLAAVREVFRSGQAQGLGGEDMSGVVRVLEALAGIEST
jgi:3-hydroxyisobutyrate dehydrogenase-like beta-hydroxyacid dehydrogenase